MDVVYVLKNHFEMSDEVNSMSKEKMKRQITILEEDVRWEKERI